MPIHSADRRPQESRRSRALLAMGSAAAAMAATAAFVSYRAHRAEQAHPPVGQFIEVDGVRLHYLERGRGRPLVLLHGNGAVLQDFEVCGLIDRAAQRYRVIAFDRPGFGYSERPRNVVWTPERQAELLRHALERLDARPAIVLGHSWGTLVAIALALEQADAVSALLLISGYYYPTARADVPLMSAPAIPVVGDLMRYTISPILAGATLKKLEQAVFAPAPVPPRFKREFPHALMLRPSQIRASAEETSIMVQAAADMEDRYGELRIPVTIVAGDGDRIVSTDAQSQRLHEQIRHSRFLRFENVGHMPHHARLDEIMAAIEAVAGPQLAKSVY